MVIFKTRVLFGSTFHSVIELVLTSTNLRHSPFGSEKLASTRKNFAILDMSTTEKNYTCVVGYGPRAQSFTTSLMEDLRQEINRVSSFSRCLNGTFPYQSLNGALPSRKCCIKASTKCKISVYVLTAICLQ